MKLQSFSVPIAARRHGVRWRLVLLVAGAALVVSSLGAAQTDAPGESVIIPGAEISGWGQVDKVPGRFGLPAGSKPKVPAVLILHAILGVDGRGAFYAKALQEAGIATLEITMFPPGAPPRAGPKATMPYAAAALKWLATQPTVDGQRLGVMGFSWGGYMSVVMSSELVQEQLGKDVPKPVAFAAFYPTCSILVRSLVNRRSAFYNAHKWMSAAPMLIQVGTRDDFEEGERPCDALPRCGRQQRVRTRPSATSRAQRTTSIRRCQAGRFTRVGSHTLYVAGWSVWSRAQGIQMKRARRSSAFSSSICILDGGRIHLSGFLCRCVSSVRPC